MGKIADEARRRQLYETGCTDKDAADLLGVSLGTITKWRIKQGLPKNDPFAWRIDAYQRYYDEGYNDRQVAERVGVTPGAVAHWRYKHGLPANGPTRRYKRLYALYDRGLSDKEIAAELKITDHAVRGWRQSNYLPCNTVRVGNRWVPKRMAAAGYA